MTALTRILMIEDDELDAELLIEILADEKSINTQVDVASRLSDALRRLDESAYDVILSDLNLPDSRGLDTFNAVNNHAKDLPILVMSGLDDENTALEAVRAGAQDYLVKGRVSGALLAKTILYSIERNRSRMELKAVNDQLQSANQRLERMAHNDSLTDLLNRRGLQDVLVHETARAQRNGTNTVVLLIDLDDFKRINDTIGHSAGDAVLKEVAARMKRPLRATDYAARVGGDEFLILLPDTMAAEGMKIAEIVRAAICDRTIDAGQPVTATASVGMICVPRKARTIDDLLAETHHVLYRSKRRGKNRVSFEGADTAGGDTPAVRVAEDLKKENAFTALIHPIIRLIDNHPVACEMLARSTIAAAERPDDFFRLSLEVDLVIQVERQCLTACVEASRSLPRALRRHINLSPAALGDITAAGIISALPDQQGSLFCVEISQNQIVGDPSYLAEPLDQLKRAGVLTAIEDVSFGKNSLESLVLLEPDFVKIDRTYITNIAEDRARMRSLERLLKLAESLGMDVIAEGIETEADLGVLKSCGVKYGQGFLWGRPSAKLDDFAAFLPEVVLNDLLGFGAVL